MAAFCNASAGLRGHPCRTSRPPLLRPSSFQREAFLFPNDEDGRWLRARVVSGGYFESRTVKYQDQADQEQTLTIRENHPPMVNAIRLAYSHASPRELPERPPHVQRLHVSRPHRRRTLAFGRVRRLLFGSGSDACGLPRLRSAPSARLREPVRGCRRRRRGYPQPATRLRVLGRSGVVRNRRRGRDGAVWSARDVGLHRRFGCPRRSAVRARLALAACPYA